MRLRPPTDATVTSTDADCDATADDDRRRPSIRASLPREIEADYPPGEEIHLVCVLKGGFVFMADLVRAMSPRVTMDFIAVSSYAQEHEVVRRGPDAEGPRHRPRRPPRHHRRGHRRHGPDADVPAGHPAGARAEDAEDGLPAEQAVATRRGRHGRVHRVHHRGSVRRRLRPRLRGEVSQPRAALRCSTGTEGSCSVSISSPRRTRGCSTSARPWSWPRAATSRRWRGTRSRPGG